MYILVQGAVPKSNSAHCLLLLHFMFNSTNYSANLIKIFYSYQHILFLPNISIVNVIILIHIYMLSYNYAAVYIQLIYKQYYTL